MKAPVCRFVKISHSNVEKVLYAPTNPIGIRNLHAGFIPVRLLKNSRKNPMIKHAVILMTNVPYGNLVPRRLERVEPTQYLIKEPSAPPSAMRKYFCKFDLSLFLRSTRNRRKKPSKPIQPVEANFKGDLAVDMTPQQDSLSGVIICPAYAGQRLRVNSFTTTSTLLLHIFAQQLSSCCAKES